jgi:N-dimethylarginine dimethylaminohydrolase
MAILMCPPDHFGVEYEINPWMHIHNQVDHSLALEQWNALYGAYGELGQDVDLVEPVPGNPDMVFTANAAVVRDRRAVMARFRHPERQGEEPFWRVALADRGYRISELPSGISFEGAGDALFVGDHLFAGYGFRTDREAHAGVGKALDVEVVSLRLVDPRFYHLDTCFCPLGPSVVMFAPGAFAPASARLIRKLVPHVIEVPLDVAAGFVCNAITIGHRVLSSVGVEQMESSLVREGFHGRALPMTEFIKAGGGVRCLSLVLD